MTLVAAAESGIDLTPRGVAYCLAHGREAIERRIERHLALVTALIGYLDDTEGDWDLEPSLGFDEPEGGDVLDERHDPGDDDEPSLGACEPRYAGGDYNLAQRRVFSAALPCGSQVGWGMSGSRVDLEDEHDGSEPENEHGPSWAEAPARRGSLFSGSDEDHEPSLSLTENVNQATRVVESSGWHFDDYEADYARDRGPTNRAVIADDEPDVTDHEDDGLLHGESDPAEADSGERILGGGHHV